LLAAAQGAMLARALRLLEEQERWTLGQAVSAVQACRG